MADWLHGYAEGPILVAVALLTQLGDVWLLFLLGGVAYVAADEVPRLGLDRRRGLFLFAIVLTYVALIGVLKGLFDLPRPPGAGEAPAFSWLPPLLEGALAGAATADGHGFPSGHALGTTMGWGGLALLLDDESVRTRVGLAAGVIALVSLSRLALGVHYLVDVVAGAAVGLVVLTGLYLLADRGTAPARVLAVAVAVGVLGLLVGVTFDSVAALGTAVGAWLAWRGVAARTPAQPTGRREVVAGLAVLALAGGLFGAVYALEPAHPVTFLGAGLTGAGVVGAPLVGSRLA
ncbi:phosphatase PAP2 family protein [Halorientalis halophila]|uniref:phosphatase PAP2 family protein n=1 Tax=Halorientalis halophila TaxID=3108499 RepID=UPI00300A00D5